MREAVGVDRIMWGSDFPHLEGCWPFSRQHLRLAFAGVPEGEVRMMVGTNAAALYDLKATPVTEAMNLQPHTTSPDVTETTAVEVFQPGYRIGDRVVRPARVAVADPE